MVQRPLLLALALFPLSAQAGVTIDDVRVARTGADGSAALLVHTTGDHTSDLARLDATVERVDGSSATLSCAVASTVRTGTASLSSLPKAESAVYLSLVGADGKALGAYSGVVGADGRLVFSAGFGPTDPALVSGFVIGEGVTFTAVISVEWAEGETFSGTLTTPDSKADVTAAVTFGAEQAEWSCALPESDGDTWAVDVRSEASFSPGQSGKTMWKTDDKERAQVVAPWDDGFAGTPALALDEVGLTSLALLAPAADDCGWGSSCASPDAYALVAVSSGWALGDTLPSAVDLAVGDGSTLSLPLNSAQRAGSVALSFDEDPTGRQIELLTDDGPLSMTPGDRGVCVYGQCFSLSAYAGGTLTLSATAYDADADALPDEIKVAFSPAGGKGEFVAPKEAFVSVALDEEIGLVFGRAVGVSPDGLGAPFAAKPNLIGMEQDGIHTSFYNARGVLVASPADNALVLGAVSHTGPEQAGEGALASGDPIGLSREGVGGVTEPLGPPVVWDANGAGTRSAIPSTRNKPGLR